MTDDTIYREKVRLLMKEILRAKQRGEMDKVERLSQELARLVDE